MIHIMRSGVVYEMTELGQSLSGILDQLCEWGEKFIRGDFQTKRKE
ncbi:winged helix-turn-helix transcriptional regulator [Paenibacillus pasadenensis]